MNLAGRGLAHWIADWRERGYTVRLVFTALDSPELALRRVASRVASGGHNVPEAVVRRRWSAGLRALFDLYLPLVERWQIFDSSDGPVREVARGDRVDLMPQILDEERWTRLLRLAALVVPPRTGQAVSSSIPLPRSTTTGSPSSRRRSISNFAASLIFAAMSPKTGDTQSASAAASSESAVRVMGSMISDPSTFGTVFNLDLQRS